MQRRDFLKLLGAGTGVGAGFEETRLWPLGLGSGRKAPATPNEYGLLECSDSNLGGAVSRSRAGILACSINDQTHCADSGRKWGTTTWLNDLYFGLCGGFFIGGADQHGVFRKELRKIAQHVQVAPGRPPVPYAVSDDGRSATFNPDGGFDLDRCAEFVLEIVRVYEMTGNRAFAFDLYPKCVEVVNYLAGRDLDGDLLLEGRTESFTDPPGKGVGACSSVTYIGDTTANTWKDFGASMFYYEALQKLGLLESILGMKDAAARRFKHAAQVRESIKRILWNGKTDGFLAWVEKNGTPHDDWITGNNLHAVACGLADRRQSARILKKLENHCQEIEEVVPCRVRIGVFEDGLCSNRPDYYWNGGIWPLVSAPDMRARGLLRDVTGALRVADLLATRPKVTDTGFFEAYDGKTGAPNDCAGVLMNNGGFLWGFFEGVLGIEVRGDELRLRASVPKRILPAKARIHYRGADLEIRWMIGLRPSASLDGKSIALRRDGYYQLKLTPEPQQTYLVEMVQSAS